MYCSIRTGLNQFENEVVKMRYERRGLAENTQNVLTHFHQQKKCLLLKFGVMRALLIIYLFQSNSWRSTYGGLF